MRPASDAPRDTPRLKAASIPSSDWVDGFWEIDHKDRGFLSREARALLGGRVPGDATQWRARVHPEDLPAAERSIDALRGGDAERLTIGCRLRRTDGTFHPLLLSGRMQGDRLCGVLLDLKRLPIDHIRFRQTMELLDEIVSLHQKDFRPVYVTPAITRLTGISPESASREASFEWVHPDDRRAILQALARARRSGEATVRWRIRCADGGWRWLETRGRVMTDPAWHPARFLCSSRDIHDEVEATLRAQWQAGHDPLTDLPNRTYFLERVGGAIAKLRPGRLLGLLFLDLDGFKQINDTLGHAVGDTLLRAVAGRLQENVRGGDIVARMGGDEFTVLLSRLTSVEEGTTIARRLLAALARPVSCGDRELFVTASIGGSFYPTDGTTAEILLRHADLAMYHAKRRGNHLCLFAPRLNAAARERLRLEHLVRRGLERGEFELHYQPLINLRTGATQAVEALLRWRNPTTEAPVSPDRLVAQAERTGLMDTLGGWIIDTACRQAASWRPILPEGTRLSINISALQLISVEFVPNLMASLARASLPPECLELEITEAVALSRDRQGLEILRDLRERGVRITLDDFGTGFSSLSLLRDLPLDAVKIDASFLDDLTVTEQAQALMRAVIELAHALRLSVVAEGVEHAAQREALSALGCDAIQGFLVSPPIAAAGIPAFLGRVDPAWRAAA